MMKPVSLGLVFLIAAIAGLPLIASAAAISVGNAIEEREKLSTNGDFGVVDTNNPVDENGSLTEFNYYASNTDPFKFLLVDGDDKVKWISDEITPSKAGKGSYKPEEAVEVKAGWNLGVYFEESANISYTEDGEDAYYTAQNYNYKLGKKMAYRGHGNRIYSFAATGSTEESEDSDSEEDKDIDEEESQQDDLAAPLIDEPEKNATTTKDFTIGWNEIDGDGILYQLEYFNGNDYSGQSVITDWISGNEVKIEDAQDGTYYLRARAKDADGNISGWSNDKSDPYRIYVGSTLLPIVEVISEKNACMMDGWQKVNSHAFANQGQCVAYYNQMLQGHIENILRIIKQKYEEMVTELQKQIKDKTQNGVINQGNQNNGGNNNVSNSAGNNH